VVALRIDVVTIFPDYFTPLELSLIGRARRAGLLDVRVHDLREATTDPHRSVDDTPYGGGPGMVMRPEPWGRVIDRVAADPPRGGAVPLLVVPTPAGRPFRQADATRWADQGWLLIACGRYEGIDGRVVVDARRRMPVEEVSVGDYVLAGGEAAALVIVEAVARLLPGVLGNEASVTDESFADHSAPLLEAPSYTRPEVWRGLAVPAVLRSGDHQAVARWRRDAALRWTAERRPDLLAAASLDEADLRALGAGTSAEITEVAGGQDGVAQ
jgi:tRNA (guanine37-N1)-methyltransferase